ncbi:MAG: HU family DNA-binding protein [Betaproteobacteria bacterium]
MNKGDLIEVVSREADLSKAAATRAVDSVLKTIVKTVSKKQTVQLIGFGTFRAMKRNARKGRNPSTGEPLNIPSSTVPKFTPGSAFKEKLSKR